MISILRSLKDLVRIFYGEVLLEFKTSLFGGMHSVKAAVYTIHVHWANMILFIHDARSCIFFNACMWD